MFLGAANPLATNPDQKAEDVFSPLAYASAALRTSSWARAFI